MIDMITFGQQYAQPTPQTYQAPTYSNTDPEIKMGSITMDFSKISNGIIPVMSSPVIATDTKNKRPRKREQTSNGIVTDSLNSESSRPLTFIESNEPYENKYTETNNILKSAIGEIDTCMREVHDDINVIRSSKTMKGKYNYLSLMQGSMGSLIGNKIAAARELNSSISKCNDLELRKYKEITAAGAASEQDENKRLQEMYSAFVNTPVGTSNGAGMGLSGPLGPSMAEMTIPSNRIVGNMLGSADAQYNEYLRNLTPTQNMMLLESDPNVKQVVVYNQETGARYFEIMNLATGEVLQNVEKHDAMFMEDVVIDIKNNIARNTNLSETYPLVIVGAPVLNEY